MSGLNSAQSRHDAPLPKTRNILGEQPTETCSMKLEALEVLGLPRVVRWRVFRRGCPGPLCRQRERVDAQISAEHRRALGKAKMETFSATSRDTAAVSR